MQGTSWLLRYGATMSPVAVAGALDLGTTGLYASFGISAMAQTASDTKEKADKISKQLIGTTYEKIASRPMVTTVWKGRQK